jgi:hypothetical protein
MSEEARQRVEIFMDITPGEALEFLQKLLEDDFREQLRKDPRSVLVDLRIEINDAGLLAFAEPPPKEHIQELLDRIGELDEYGRVGFLPLGFGWFVIVVGFAMPLVAADMQEADSALV